MKTAALAFLLLNASLFAQTPSTPAGDPWTTLAFLEGTWEAKTLTGSGVSVAGTYTFQTELGGHILARHSTSTGGCKGPATFDCEHGDLLYVYPEPPSGNLKGIYFDNEGHVIHYDVSTPNATTVVFLSDGSTPGPQFQLVYTLDHAILSGKFQMRMPGQIDWKSYLEWSGPKK